MSVHQSVGTGCGDAISLGLIGATVMQWLPVAVGTFAAALACLWYVIQIWESPYGRWWIAKWRFLFRVIRALAHFKRKSGVITTTASTNNTVKEIVIIKAP